MLRRLHSFPGLIAALLVCFMALTGAVLSLDPLLQQMRGGQGAAGGVSVAQLAASVADNFADPERIVRTASGSVIVYHAGDSGQAADYVDPQTGSSTGAYEPSAVFGFFTELHRSLFLGTAGHGVAGIGAAALAILSLSGVFMLAARLGGWRKLFSRARGTLGQRLHVELARFAMLGLLLTSLTGTYMTLVSFELLPDGSSDSFVSFPVSDGGTPAPVAGLAALTATPLTDLRELVFPAAGDATDVFTITTRSGQGFVDQATGAMLSFTPNTLAQTIYETFYMLHTGQGAAWLGLALGFVALAAPVMAASGALIWWGRRRGVPRIAQNAAAAAADTVILVGSDGNSTWGFAAALHVSLTAAGHKVHTAPMNALSADYRCARRMFILAATYGDGTAPASASRFLARLDRLSAPPALEFAVLGFGDRRFQYFCGFAAQVDAALGARGWTPLQPMDTIDRQSPQAFTQWAATIGARIGTPLAVTHTPPRPPTVALTLAGRVEYGREVQAPTVVLRFVEPGPRLGLAGWLDRRSGLPRFEAGDLVGILPPGSTVPRYYSLASGAREGFLEICVRKQQGGLCSEFLHALEPGDTIEAFVKDNPEFRPGRGKAPVIMIGAGTGIAPLVGFAWNNASHRPMHLYWGGRDPQSDFLYEDNLAQCLDDKRLTRVVTAFSRIVDGAYVQDKVRADADSIRTLVQRGARIMVCGGKEMAQGVMEVVNEIILPLGADVGSLKAAGRYLEDVY